VIVIVIAVIIFLYKLKTRQTPVTPPPAEGAIEMSEEAKKPDVTPQVTAVDESEQPSGRLKYPDNPEVVESGRTIGEGY